MIRGPSILILNEFKETFCAFAPLLSNSIKKFAVSRVYRLDQTLTALPTVILFPHVLPVSALVMTFAVILLDAGLSTIESSFV